MCLVAQDSKLYLCGKEENEANDCTTNMQKTTSSGFSTYYVQTLLQTLFFFIRPQVLCADSALEGRITPLTLEVPSCLAAPLDLNAFLPQPLRQLLFPFKKSHRRERVRY